MARLLLASSGSGVYSRAFRLLHIARFSASEPQSAAGDTPEVLSREEYNRRYAAYQKELHNFRLKTKEEIAQKKAEEERLAAVREPILAAEQAAAIKAERKEQRRLASKRKKQLKKQLQIARQRKEAAFDREVKRRELLAKAEDDRYAELLQQSRSWITAETLDDRIASALDNSTTLY